MQINHFSYQNLFKLRSNTLYYFIGKITLLAKCVCVCVGGEGGWRIIQMPSLLIPEGRYAEGSAQD